jgi:hypothetical protein
MSLEKNDLARLVHNELHIDDFQSKLGDNKDVIVVSFKVAGKEPAADIGGFVEKGYDWILDADVSAGEMSDGDYIVFVEIPRDQDAPENIIAMMSDLMNLTDQDLDDWRVRYYHGLEDHPLNKETLAKIIPLTPEDYERAYGHKEIDQLKNAAGVKVTTKAPKNEFTENLRVAAGIK